MPKFTWESNLLSLFWGWFHNFGQHVPSLQLNLFNFKLVVSSMKTNPQPPHFANLTVSFLVFYFTFKMLPYFERFILWRYQLIAFSHFYHVHHTYNFITSLCNWYLSRSNNQLIGTALLLVYRLCLYQILSIHLCTNNLHTTQTTHYRQTNVHSSWHTYQ